MRSQIRNTDRLNRKYLTLDFLGTSVNFIIFQGNLQSVAGASAFCGKIEGVLQYSAQNQVIH